MDERASSRARAGGRGAAVALPVLSARGLQRLADALKARLAHDVAAEAASGRLILWLPAAFTAGILLYFGASTEPSLVASLVLVAAFAAAALAAAGSDFPEFREQELSDRERQILELLGQGYGNHQIAERLDLSVRTVESYCTRAIDKLGLEGMKALRRYAAQNHRLLLTPTP